MCVIGVWTPWGVGFILYMVLWCFPLGEGMVLGCFMVFSFGGVGIKSVGIG